MVNLLPTILYACMIGMTLLALLDVVRRPKEKQYQRLTGLLTLLLIHLAGELFIYSGAFVYAPSLAGFELPFRLLLGPALYFYAHASMSPNEKIDRRLIYFALSGPLVVCISLLPFIFMLSPTEKLALANPETRNPDLWQIAVFTCVTTTAIFITYTMLFLRFTFNLHNNHIQQLMERYSDIEKRSLDWLKSMLFVWGFIWSMYAIQYSLGALGWTLLGFEKVLPLCETFALALFIQSALNQKPLNESEKGLPETKQARTSLLSTKHMADIADKLTQAMQEDRLYLNEDLSLNKLSEHISESENHISETLSQFMHTNFFQFVNRFRIEEAKFALTASKKLVTDIAFDVGFNSKSTFNAAFKKAVGMTPSAYRKNN
ncbi:helix-turn-helix domain-containing protein [Pseudoalteromonas xiamenensis]